MTHQVRVTAEALAEAGDAARWYEERHEGLGQEFLGALDRAIESIAQWPGIGTPVTGTELATRRAPVGRYPYFVAYLDDDEVVTVIALAHERRRPAYWAGRSPS